MIQMFLGGFFVLSADSILKREKRLRTRRVHFENVTVYYFSRRQGFTSVPSQGGSTLGMSNRHSWIRQYSLGEFALEQERIHRDMLRDHLKEEKLNSIKLKVNAPEPCLQPVMSIFKCQSDCGLKDYWVF